MHTFERKKDVFMKVLKEYKLSPSQALVIGDRVEEEIKDANALGIPSVLVLRPHWPVIKNVATPTMRVRSMHALVKKICTLQQ